jgi:hypothetical protein
VSISNIVYLPNRFERREKPVLAGRSDFGIPEKASSWVLSLIESPVFRDMTTQTARGAGSICMPNTAHWQPKLETHRLGIGASRRPCVSAGPPPSITAAKWFLLPRLPPNASL